MNATISHWHMLSLDYTSSKDASLPTWTSLAQSLINLKEFIYLQ